MKPTLSGPKKKRIVMLTIGGLFVFYLLVSFFLGERGVLKDVELRSERAALKEEIARLKDENARLSAEVESLKHDPEHMEKLAREQGLVKKGEIVYQYEDER